jgi:hypothetical protein
MSSEAWVRALKKKLASQGTKLDEHRSTGLSLFFITSSGKGFTVPVPPTDNGWTFDQQEFIATTLEYYDLEFWPLNLYC